MKTLVGRFAMLLAMLIVLAFAGASTTSGSPAENFITGADGAVHSDLASEENLGTFVQGSSISLTCPRGNGLRVFLFVHLYESPFPWVLGYGGTGSNNSSLSPLTTLTPDSGVAYGIEWHCVAMSLNTSSLATGTYHGSLELATLDHFFQAFYFFRFTVTSPPPTVTTSAATSVTGTTAMLNGSANPNGTDTTAWFRYSTIDPGTCNDSFGTRAPVSGGLPLGSGTAAVPYSVNLTGLTAGTVYYFCALAQNSQGTAFGSVLSFTTPPPPMVTTSAATSVTGTTAMLNGSANPNGTDTTAWFRYSTIDPGTCNDSFGTRAPASGGLPLGSGTAAVPYSVNLTGLTAGTIYYFCALAQNSQGTAFGSVLSFATSMPPTDSTPPATTISLNPGAPNGSNGWYVVNVRVTVSASDGSGVAETRCALDPASVPATFDDLPGGCAFAGAGADVTAEGAHRIYAASKDNAGNKETPKSQTFKLDKTGPSASLSAAGTMGSNGWYVGNVTITTSGTDSISSPVTCTANQSQNADTPGASFSGACTNDAGLSTNAALLTIKRDATAPVVVVTGVTNGATYSLGAVPPVGCSVTDATSGVAANAVLSLNGGPVGSVTATCNGAKDNAGNTGQASVTFNVAYNWTGFFQPVDNPGSASTPVFNRVKSGSAIPIKFSLGGNQGLNILATGYPRSVSVPCGSAATIDDVEQTVSAGDSSLTYDATANQYIYVWKTDNAYAYSCRKLIVRLLDGTEHYAYFKFTK